MQVTQAGHTSVCVFIASQSHSWTLNYCLKEEALQAVVHLTPMPNLHMPTDRGGLGMLVKQPWTHTYVGIRLFVQTHNAKMVYCISSRDLPFILLYIVQRPPVHDGGNQASLASKS